MNETLVTLVGNAATGVEYRETASGGMARFRLAVTPRRWDREKQLWGDGHTSFYTVWAWRGLASNVAASVSVGEPLLVHGRLKVREEEREGARRTFVDVEAVAVGHDLNRGSAAFRRATRREAPFGAEAGGGGGGDAGAGAGGARSSGPPPAGGTDMGAGAGTGAGEGARTRAGAGPGGDPGGGPGGGPVRGPGGGPGGGSGGGPGGDPGGGPGGGAVRGPGGGPGGGPVRGSAGPGGQDADRPVFVSEPVDGDPFWELGPVGDEGGGAGAAEAPRAATRSRRPTTRQKRAAGVVSTV